MSARSRFPQVWFRGVWQAGVILIVAAAMAVIVNHLRQDGLPLVVERSPEDGLVQERLGFSLAVSLDEARALFLERQAVFLDARSPEVYQLGHILGARTTKEIRDLLGPEDFPNETLMGAKLLYEKQGFVVNFLERQVNVEFCLGCQDLFSGF